MRPASLLFPMGLHMTLHLKLFLDLVKSKVTLDPDDVSGSLGAGDLMEKGKSEYKKWALRIQREYIHTSSAVHRLNTEGT